MPINLNPSAEHLGLIAQAIGAKLFKSLGFDPLGEIGEAHYEVTNPKGMLCLSWAKKLDSPVQWHPVTIRRADGLYSPPLTKLKTVNDSQLRYFLTDKAHEKSLGPRLQDLASRARSDPHALNTFREIFQKRQSGERLVKAFQALPKLSKYHLIVCYREGSLIQFGIMASPRQVEGTTIRKLPHFWGDPLKEWLNSKFVPPPATVWDKLLDEDLFPG